MDINLLKFLFNIRLSSALNSDIILDKPTRAALTIMIIRHSMSHVVSKMNVFVSAEYTKHDVRF